MAEVVYVLCAVLSVACAVLLYRGYRRSNARFLAWCAACFACLAVNNILLFIDKVVYPEDALFFAGLSFALWRGITALLGVGLLLFGLIWDAE